MATLKFKAPRTSRDSTNARSRITGVSTSTGTAALDTVARHDRAVARIAVVDGVMNLLLKFVAVLDGLGAVTSLYR